MDEGDHAICQSVLSGTCLVIFAFRSVCRRCGNCDISFHDSSSSTHHLARHIAQLLANLLHILPISFPFAVRVHWMVYLRHERRPVSHEDGSNVQIKIMLSAVRQQGEGDDESTPPDMATVTVFAWTGHQKTMNRWQHAVTGAADTPLSPFLRHTSGVHRGSRLVPEEVATVVETWRRTSSCRRRSRRNERSSDEVSKLDRTLEYTGAVMRWVIVVRGFCVDVIQLRSVC